MSTYPVNSTWVGVPLVTMRPFEITSWRFQRLKIQKVLICPAKIHRLGRTCAAFPQCASSTLLLTCLSFSSLLLTLQQPARCKTFFHQDTLSGCNTTIRARSFSMGPQRSSCEMGKCRWPISARQSSPQTSRIHAAVGASTEPKGSLVWMTLLTQNWDGKVHSSTMADGCQLITYQCSHGTSSRTSS